MLRRSNHFVLNAIAVGSPLVAGFLSLHLGRAQAQEKTPPAPSSFDVASIKPSSPNPKFFLQPYPNGRLAASGVTLKFLVQWAYQVQDFQVSGGPGWINTKRYDINATAGAGSHNWLQTVAMTQALLADRFKLAVHRDRKEMQLYVMKVSKGGPKLREAAQDQPCAGPPKDTCGALVFTQGFIRLEHAPLSRLGYVLPMILTRPVRDETGLEGIYDIEVKWTPELPASVSGVPGDSRPDSDPEGPSIFTAFQEQLGLKLESTHGPVEMIVIDHVEEPSAN